MNLKLFQFLHRSDKQHTTVAPHKLELNSLLIFEQSKSSRSSFKTGIAFRLLSIEVYRINIVITGNREFEKFTRNE